MGNDDAAIEVLQRGLLANPDNWLIHNNLAVSLVLRGNLRAAEEELALARPPAGEPGAAATVSATAGLIAYRKGLITLGFSLYEAATASFAKMPNIRAHSLAQLFWAREEMRAASPNAAAVLARAAELARRTPTSEIQKLLTELQSGKI
jgi:tetratricopeptide (TPR) repeat protein